MISAKNDFAFVSSTNQVIDVLLKRHLYEIRKALDNGGAKAAQNMVLVSSVVKLPTGCSLKIETNFIIMYLIENSCYWGGRNGKTLPVSPSFDM